MNLILNWFDKCMLSFDTKDITFAKADTKIYVLLCSDTVTLSVHNNEKPLEQFKSGFKKTIKWNKHKTKISVQN